jgi:UTP--glucose-1-phosphate uridylyltransferase
MQPLTRAIAKEMLPLGRRPLLEHVLLELRAAGVAEVAIVMSPDKTSIREYFADGAELSLRCTYIMQPEMRGVGDAVLRAADWCGGEPFAVAFGDTLVRSSHSIHPTRRMLEAFAAAGADGALLAQLVDAEATRRYGIVAPVSPVAEPATSSFRVAGLVEKPGPDLAPSRRAVAARWVLGPGILGVLGRAEPGTSGEIGLTDNVDRWIATGAAVVAAPMLEGEERCDIGNWRSYLVSCARFALEDPDFGPDVRAACRATS